MTLAIAHRDPDGSAVLDALREAKPPFSPEKVVKEFSALLTSYKIRTIGGDKYAGVWPVEMFKSHSITYDQCARPKSELYGELLPLLNGRTVQLLDNKRLIQQLVGLERRTTRGTGRDIIDHQPGAHDDLINAATGALVMLSGRKYRYDSSLQWVGSNEDFNASWRTGSLLDRIFSSGRFRRTG